MKLRIKQVKEDTIGKVDLLSRDLYKLKMAKAISDAFHDKIHQLIRNNLKWLHPSGLLHQ